MSLDAVVIGAGHAGLAVSRRLVDAGIEHVVLERGEIGESWRAQRWDSFVLNTPNAINQLPGGRAAGPPNGFLGRDAWIAELEAYARHGALPVRTHATVTAVTAVANGEFAVSIGDADALRTRNIVVAAGAANVHELPAAAGSIDRRVEILTTATYRRPAQLSPGAVLVVGSAQSGCQIAEDLLEAGREVYLATGTVGRLPRRLHGRDTLIWLAESGWMTQRPQDLADPALMRAAQPLVSGVGPLGHSVSLQWLASRGVTLLGHFESADGGRLRFGEDLALHVRCGDEISAKMHQHVDDYLARQGIDAPGSDPDPADEPADPLSFSAPTELDLGERGIRTVIFSTGFRPDHSWLHLPVFGADGSVAHEQGRSRIDGVWFVGLLWMRMRRSGIILGAMDDSAHVAAQVAARCRAPSRSSH
ncbi:MAG TPA: NAD(P)/FAD-dependent oxidoreductase [Candidatus Limnocylindria bacterium]|jgi:putative flavoprotein involved in K+ transport|nr:NAD(P)/FAD-dependent oxidoreductase [Candidatus Limnocylindria bacterium]